MVTMNLWYIRHGGCITNWHVVGVRHAAHVRPMFTLMAHGRSVMYIVFNNVRLSKTSYLTSWDPSLPSL